MASCDPISPFQVANSGTIIVIDDIEHREHSYAPTSSTDDLSAIKCTSLLDSHINEEARCVKDKFVLSYLTPEHRFVSDSGFEVKVPVLMAIGFSSLLGRREKAYDLKRNQIEGLKGDPESLEVVIDFKVEKIRNFLKFIAI